MPEQITYICTNCGNEVEDLYKQFGSVAVKLTTCVSYLLSIDKFKQFVINIFL